MGRNLYGRKIIKYFLKICTFFIFLTFTIKETIVAQSSKQNEVQIYEYKELGFEGVNNKKVNDLRTKYLTTHKQWLFNILDNSESYRVFVRNELEKRNMPAILEYLPVVESNYNPTAKSKSGATGMWQFMLNSVKPFLICNEYIDERLDPWKSTTAALTKLQENYNMFGDWLLAITAYNCGAGALQRTINKAENKNFWYLSENGFLSEQASGYVPKLLAIADVTENAKFYGIEMPSARDNNGKTIELRAGSFDYISVNKSISLKVLANELRIDESELTRLNLALIKGCTPPNSTYKIRLPEGMKHSAEYILKEIYN